MNDPFGSGWLACLWYVPLLLLSPARAGGQDAAVRAGSTTEQETQYYDLGCGGQAWVGYFAPDRWIKSDPLGHTYEREDWRISESDITFTIPRTETIRWSIEVPTDGYLSFGIQPVTPGAMTAIGVVINGRLISEGIPPDGIYYSPYLRAGDRFSLLIPPGQVRYHWANLLFHSNYTGVIVRAGEHLPRRRFQPVVGSKVNRISFPADEGGWPVYDADGDETTLDDRRVLRGNTELFEVSYTDEVDWTELHGPPVLRRTFIIREICVRGNVMWKTVTWSALPILPERE